MRKIRLSVLISGNGSNLQALIDSCVCKSFPAQVELVISNKADAYGLERAQKSGIKSKIIDHKEYETKEAFEEALDKALCDAQTDLVCLAGFMRILSPRFVNKWNNRMINIHPSLLPAYKGLHTHERAIEDGVRFAGCTVHYVRPEMDNGPVILQAVVPIEPDETPDTLAKKVLKQEHIIYPEAVRLIGKGRVRVRGHHAIIDDMKVPVTGLMNPLPGSSLT